MARNLTDIYAAIATYAGAVTGIRSAHYPVPAALPLPPTLLVVTGRNVITHGSQQMHTLRVRTHLMVSTTEATDTEIVAVDELLFPLVDAFAADIDDTDGFTLGGLVDRCVVSEWDEIATFVHAGMPYIGYPVFFDVKVQRSAGVY